jgi:hypothetical protein
MTGAINEPAGGDQALAYDVSSGTMSLSDSSTANAIAKTVGSHFTSVSSTFLANGSTSAA